ncbi:HAD family hydrolase [Acidovorax sp.]|uniref:HAD family hydrolase n=1 Tax=Acidovorax sp. TaxID=1872122 RepID=UPI0026223804|nr:HAD family hydrolase [Acidovorax sp.]
MARASVSKPVIALDADGVLLDYNAAYAEVWEKVFGKRPVERDPSAYWAMDRWSVERLDGRQLELFRAGFDEEFWSRVPAVGSALEACFLLHDAGYTLVCVTALQPRFENARLRNLRDLGFPIERVIATGGSSDPGSSKKAAVRMLGCAALVDDYLPNLIDLGPSIHTALITRQPNGSPNTGWALAHVNSSHTYLAEFARWWLHAVP